MPANLTPDYHAAEARFRAARTNEERLSALEAMLATIPKHKGTEKLQADIKRRISKLREKQPDKMSDFKFTQQGDKLVAVIGSRSALLVKPLTGSSENSIPFASVIKHRGLAVQFVFLSQAGDVFSDVLKKADALALVIDLADDLLLDYFEDCRFQLLQIGINISGASELDPGDDLSAKPVLVVAVDQKAEYASENLESLVDFCGDEFTVCTFSPEDSDEIEELREALINLTVPD